MNKPNAKKIGVLLSYTSLVVGCLIHFFYNSYMLRALGESEHGIYSLANSFAGYLTLLGLGMTSAYIRFQSPLVVQKKEGEIPALNGLFLIMYSIMAIVAVGIGFILSNNVELIFQENLTPQERSLAKTLVLIMSVNIALSFPTNIFTSLVSAHEEFVFQRLVELSRTILNPCVGFLLLAMGYRSVSISVLALVLTVLGLAVNIYFCLRILKERFSFRNVKWGMLRQIFSYSVFIFINQIVNQINWSTDKLLLGLYVGAAQISVYEVASLINNYYSNISTAIVSVFIPRVHRMAEEQEDNGALSDLFIRVGRVQYLIMALICTVLIFLGRPFFHLFGGEAYAESYYVCLLLIIPVTIPLIQNIGIQIQQARNMHRFRSWVYLGISVINILISIPLCQRWGAVGAAAGTAVSLLAGNGVLMNWYYGKKMHLDIKSFWLQILKISRGILIPSVFGVIILICVPVCSLWAFIGLTAAYVVLYAVSMWFFGMNVEEKEMVRKPLSKIGIRLP